MFNFLETAGDVIVLPESLMDRLWYALKVSGTGILKVFLVLVILMAAIVVMQKVCALLFGRTKDSSKAEASEPVAAPAPASTPVSQPAPAAVPTAGDDVQMAAVVAAAVAAYMDAEFPTTKYRISSFRSL